MVMSNPTDYHEQRDQVNPLLKELEERGFSLWLTRKGDICYRTSTDDKITSVKPKQFQDILSNYLGREIKIFSNDENNQLNKSDLILVSKEFFNPTVNSEFIPQNGVYMRNTFCPTAYMVDKSDNHYDDFPSRSVIRKLMLHLSNGRTDYIAWIENWLAYHFQFRQKPKAALALIGSNFSGKNILWENIIKPLFSENLTTEVGKEDLKKESFSQELINQLFYNINAIDDMHMYSDEEMYIFSNLILNDTATFNQKYQGKVTMPLHGAVLITTNNTSLYAEKSIIDLITVIQTHDSLTESNFLGCGSYAHLRQEIIKELPLYARYLHQLSIDKTMANTALNTPCRQEVLDGRKDNISAFCEAIENLDLTYFDPLHTLKTHLLYLEIKEGFEKGRIKKSALKFYFNALYNTDVSSKKLLSELRARNATLFDDTHATRHDNGDVFYIIDSMPSPSKEPTYEDIVNGRVSVEDLF